MMMSGMTIETRMFSAAGETLHRRWWLDMGSALDRQLQQETSDSL